MARRPDAALEVALEQRQETFQQAQQVLSARELALQAQAQALFAAHSRVRMVLGQIDAAQRPLPGVPLAVGVLGDLERLLDWCEVQVLVEQERLEAVQAEADEARGWMASAHQAVKALEGVLAKRAAERAEAQPRVELREADEIAARVHARQVTAA